MPAGGTSPYAEEGTALHSCMEMILEGEVDSPADLLAKDVGGVVIDEDHVERLNMALSAWDAFCVENNIIDYAQEQTFELTEDIGGTTDVKAWSEDMVFIVDWKFGQGVEVDAEDSAQGMFYGLCVEHNEPELFEGRGMAVVIIQPIPSRHDHQTTKTWRVPPDVYSAFKRDLFAAIEYEGEPQYNMGSGCKFCPGASICPAKTGAADVALRIGTEVGEALSFSLDLALQLEDWIKNVKKTAHEQMEAGNALAGFKLVPKRAMRSWNDPEAIEKKLRQMAKNSRGGKGIKVSDVLTEPKLLSVAQVEQVFKRKKLDMSKISDYIVSLSSGTTLARDSDSRPAVLSTDALRKALGRIS